MTFQYNDEMLLTEADRASAEHSFPNVFFALDHPALRSEFSKFDALANRAKARSQSWGVTSVVLATSALILAAFEGVIHSSTPHDAAWQTVPTAVAVAAALLGVVAALIASFGLMYRQSKIDWLHNRLITERLRQWHAQSFVGRFSAIVAAARSPQARKTFLATRDAEFKEFQRLFIAKVSAEFPRYIGARGTDHGAGAIQSPWIRREWTDRPLVDSLPADDPLVREALAAYEMTRMTSQVQYTSFKLLEDAVPFWTHAPVQARVLKRLGWTCVAALMLLHLVIVLGVIANVPSMNSSAVHASAVSMAILALAGRTLEEGLQPHREIERLEAYLLRLTAAEHTFKTTDQVAQQLGAMREIERAAVAEMVGFLSARHESTFVM
jgi:hypothetical protein